MTIKWAEDYAPVILDCFTYGLSAPAVRDRELEAENSRLLFGPWDDLSLPEKALRTRLSRGIAESIWGERNEALYTSEVEEWLKRAEAIGVLRMVNGRVCTE